MAKWLMLLYRLPREPSAPRVAIWRALKLIEGGEYLQDGVFVLKATELNVVTLENLAHDIRNYGGEATLAMATVDDDRHLRSRLKAAVSAGKPTDVKVVRARFACRKRRTRAV